MFVLRKSLTWSRAALPLFKKYYVCLAFGGFDVLDCQGLHIFISHIILLTYISVFHFLYEFSVTLLFRLLGPGSFCAKRSSFVAHFKHVVQLMSFANDLRKFSYTNQLTLAWYFFGRKVKSVSIACLRPADCPLVLQFSVTSVVVSSNDKLKTWPVLLYEVWKSEITLEQYHSYYIGISLVDA